MTFLRKLITLSGCAKLKRKADNEILDNEACLGLEAVEGVEGVEGVTEVSGLVGAGPGSPHPATYVPWRSPAVASRRLLDRVRDSPRVARRVLASEDIGPILYTLILNLLDERKHRNVNFDLDIVQYVFYFDFL